MTDKELKDALDSIEDRPLAWPKTAHPVVTKDFTDGNRAAILGRRISTLPTLPPQRRKQWLKGWRVARAFTNSIDAIFGKRRRPRSK